MTKVTNNSTGKISGAQKCAWCRGNGRWNISPGQNIPCIVCGGQGQVFVVQPPIYCRQCQGIGRATQTNPCLTCAGTGWEGVLGQ
jgi:DnaJ-class molecular chaperone